MQSSALIMKGDNAILFTQLTAFNTSKATVIKAEFFLIFLQRETLDVNRQFLVETLNPSNRGVIIEGFS